MTRRQIVALLGRAVSGSETLGAFESHDLEELVGVAVEQGVDRLLWSELEHRAAGAALRRELGGDVRGAVAKDLFVRREVERVTHALAEGGLPALLTKGTALAYTVYAQPWQRPRVDTDVLVRYGDLTPATQILQRCGYSRSDATNTGALVSHQIAFERTDEHGVHHIIDLHWKVANPQLVADALNFDDLWRGARPVPALGTSARVPSAVDSLSIACVHRLAHHQGQERLIWLYDLKLLAETLKAEDWDVLRELAYSRQIAGFCLDGLRAARAQVGCELPTEVEEALSNIADKEPTRVYLEGPLTKTDVLLSDLKVLDNWRDRARLVREHAFPPAAFIRHRYGIRTRWLLPALYLRRLVAGASRWVRS